MKMSVIKSLTNPEREWTTREQLILASAVLKSGDQNWVSVSRAIKPVLEVESGSADNFSHKNCAQQYSTMLDKAGTHKRKRSIDGSSEVETAGQQIVRELVDQYLTELDQALAQSREEYLALKKEMDQIEKGELDAQLPSMWEGIQAELALSKASSGSRKKSSPSKSSLSKQLDQAKQRRKGSPGSAHSTGLMRSLSSGAAGTKKTAVVSVMREDVAGADGHGEEERARGQMAALLSHGSSPAGSVASDSEHPLAVVVGGDRLHSPLPLVQSPSVAQERGTVSPEVSGGTLTVGGVVFPAGGAATVLPTGGMVLSTAGIGQEQVGVAESVAALSGIDTVSEKKVKLELASSLGQKTVLSPTSTKQVSPLSSLVKLPLDVRNIKREPPSSSPTLETSSPRLQTTPIKEEKVWLPMQTPPSTHVSQMPAEVHVIIQQPNAAAVLVQDRPSAPHVSHESSAGAVPKLPLGSSTPSISLSSPSLYSVTSGNLVTSVSFASSTVAGHPVIKSSNNTSPGIIPSGCSPLSVAMATSTLPGTAGIQSGASLSTVVSASSTSHHVGSGTAAIPSVLSTGSGMGLVVTGGLQVHSGTVPIPVLGTSSIPVSNGSPAPVISPILGTSPVPGTGIVPTSDSIASVVNVSPTSLKQPVSGSAIITAPPSTSTGSSSATLGSVVLPSSTPAASVSHISKDFPLRSPEVRVSINTAATHITSGVGTSSIPVIIPTNISPSTTGGSVLKVKTRSPVSKVKPASSSASVTVKTGVSVSPDVKVSSSISVIPSVSVATSVGVHTSIGSVSSVLSPGIRVRSQAAAVLVASSNTSRVAAKMAVASSNTSRVAAKMAVASSNTSRVAAKMAVSPTLPSATSRYASTSTATPVIPSNPALGVALRPVLSAGVVTTPSEGGPVKSVTVKHRPMVLSKEVIKINIKEGLSLHPSIKKSPGTLDLTSSLLSTGVKSHSITSPSSSRSAPPQSNTQVMVSSSSPLLPSAGNPLLSSHLLGAPLSAAKTNVVPALTMSPTLVNIGGISKSSSAPAPISASQSVPRQKATTTTEHTTVKIVSSKPSSSHSDVSVNSNKVSPSSTSAAAPATRTFSVANTSAVVAHCVSSVTSTKPKLAATAMAGTTVPSLKTTSPTSRSLASASLTIPVLAPSKELISVAKQTGGVSSPTTPTGRAASVTEPPLLSPVSRSPVGKSESKIKIVSPEPRERKRTRSESELKQTSLPVTVSMATPLSVIPVAEGKLPSVSKSPVTASKKSPEKTVSPCISSPMEVVNKAQEEVKREEKVGHGSNVESREETPVAPSAAAEDNTSPSTILRETTPMGSVEQDTPHSCDLDSSVQSKPDTGRSHDELDVLDDEAPLKASTKSSKSSLKKQWNTRSRKRKTPQHRSQSIEEGHSVESTDTEDDMVSHPSAVTSPAPSQSDDSESILAHRQWKKAIILVWRHAAQHKYANLFLHPVKEDDAPGYRNVILRPMDLSTIKKKIDSGLIKTDIEFQRDMLLMFQNAFMYNSAEHEVYYMAMEMKNDVMENIQAYLATQAQLQLMEETTPSKILRSREGRYRDSYEEHMSPAKRRRTRADDV